MDIFLKLLMWAVICAVNCKVSPDKRVEICPPSSNLLVGSIGTFDKLLQERRVSSGGITNGTVGRTAIFIGEESRIAYIMAVENGETQEATVEIIFGGLQSSNVTLSFQSVLSKGFDYTIVIWGTQPRGLTSTFYGQNEL